MIYQVYPRVNKKCVTRYITMKNEAKTEFLSVRLSKEMKAELEEIAEKEERTLSWVVAKILEKHLKSGRK